MKRFLAVYIGTEDAQKRARWNELTPQQREALTESVRGVNIMRVEGGRIVEARGYVKQVRR